MSKNHSRKSDVDQVVIRSENLYKDFGLTGQKIKEVLIKLNKKYNKKMKL